jgi:hypothetical protein
MNASAGKRLVDSCGGQTRTHSGGDDVTCACITDNQIMLPITVPAK